MSFLAVKSRLENFQIGKLNLVVKTEVALGNFQAECHWAKALTRGPTNGELSEALFQAGKSLFSNAGGLLLDVDNKYDGHEVFCTTSHYDFSLAHSRSGASLFAFGYNAGVDNLIFYFNRLFHF